MKKSNIKKLLKLLVILPYIMGCSSNEYFPYEVGDRLDQIDAYYMKKSLDWEVLTFFEYEHNNYILRSDIHKIVIIEMHIFPVKNVTKEDFYKLQYGMNVYDVIEIVGLPYRCDRYELLFKTSDGSFSCAIGFEFESVYSKDAIMV